MKQGITSGTKGNQTTLGGKDSLRTSFRDEANDGTVLVIRNRPEKLKRALRYLTGYERYMSGRQKFFWLLWIEWTVAVVFASLLLVRYYPEFGIAAVTHAGVGWWFFIIAFALLKLCSASRYVNASGKRSWGMIVGLPVLTIASAIGISILFQIFAGNGTWEPSSGLRLAHELYSPFGAPLEALGIVAIGTAWILIPAGLLGILRYRKIKPHSDELTFCSEIVGWLLNDLEQDAKCTISLRPFPALWTARWLTPSGGRPGFYDDLLDFSTELTGIGRLRITSIHRRTSKGRRKHKGYKQKVKTRISLTLPTTTTEALNSKKVHTALERALSSTNPQKEIAGTWVLLRPNDIQVAVAKGKVCVNIITGGVRTFTELGSKDLPHPHHVLAAVQGLIQGISSQAPSEY